MTLNREEVTRLVGAYDTYKGIVAKAAEVLPFSGPTIAKYWRAEGLEIKRKERKLRADGRAVHAISKINISKIIKAHETYKGDLVDATKNLPFAKPTIAKYWAEKELERVYRLRGYPRPVIRFTDEKIEEIIEAHRTYNGMVAAAARELNVSKSSVLKYWEQEDLERKTYKKNPHVQLQLITQYAHSQLSSDYSDPH